MPKKNKKNSVSRHKKSGKGKKPVTKGPKKAELADRHILYQDSVQNVESEIDFVEETFKALRGREAVTVREDFCGTANTSCEWIRRGDEHTAIGVDLEPSVLEWGKEHNLSKLTPEQQKRITLHEDNVLTVDTGKVDVTLAMNFSYWCFKERAVMCDYFQKVHNSLNDDGIMFLDSFGGYEAFQLMEEEHDYDGFTYIWDQAHYDPITGDCTCHIHFKFSDGSRMKEAFTYEWRLWTLPEIQELLKEAGFSKVTVYWDIAEDDDDEDFQPSEHGEPYAGWLAYIVAEK